MDQLTRDLPDAEASATEDISPGPHDEVALTGANARVLSSTTSHSQRRDYLTETMTGAHDSNVDPIELRRIHTYRLQHAATVGSRHSVVPREQWLPFGAGKPYPPSLPGAEEFVVEFTGPHDSLHPHNWPLGTKCVQDLCTRRN